MTRKAAKNQSNIARLIDQNDPLQYPVKRPRVGRKVVESIVPTRQRSAFGHLMPNWVGAGMLAHTLRAVYTNPDETFVRVKEDLKARGFVKRPQELDFDILSIVEGSFPALVSIEDLARRLNRKTGEISARLSYLREFVAVMCGINVLRDGKGNVGIADAQLWMAWQNRMARMMNGVRESQERHGLNIQNVVRHSLQVSEELPSIQPFILEIKPEAVSAGN